MNSKYSFELDHEVPLETNIEFINKCIQDLRNRRSYLKHKKKIRDRKLNENQLTIEKAIAHEEGNDRSHEQDNKPESV